MKEQIHTIPVNDAFNEHDECPFCFLERKAEQSTIRFLAGPGASYMEPDVRAATDEVGFCTHHSKKLYDYGNTLGSALMLQTYYARMLNEFILESEQFEMPSKKNLFGKRKPSETEPYWQRLEKKVNSCFICDRVNYHMDRYFSTFFYMLKDPEFRQKVESSKGFCMRHFAQLLHSAEAELSNAHREWFYPTVFGLMKENLARVKDDLDWLIAKYDYRNAGADWKNSRDAVSRTMEKLQGLHPADPPFKKD